MTEKTQLPDRIENVVEIQAPLDRVWTLVSAPGWWLGDGPDGIQAPPAATRECYPVRAVDSQPQDYCSFRWAPTTPDTPLTDDNSTLIEFFLAESDDVVTVRVLETGFAALAVSEETRIAGHRDNTEGWQTQLGALREAAEVA